MLDARAAAATWAKEISRVLLGLCSQVREDNGFSLAEAVFSTPLVLPDESLQEEEFSIHQISKNLSKILDASVFSLPNKHNSGHRLPEELPGDLLYAPLVWLHCSSIIPPLQRSYNGPYAAASGPSPSELGPGTRSSPSAGSSHARTQAVCDAVTDCLAWWLSLPWRSTHTQAGLIFRPPGFYSIMTGAAKKTPGSCFFLTPPGGFVHAPDQLLLPSLHSSSTRNDRGDCQGGLTSDFASSQGSGGEPCGAWLHP
jgi:hypothetical protein